LELKNVDVHNENRRLDVRRFGGWILNTFQWEVDSEAGTVGTKKLAKKDLGGK